MSWNTMSQSPLDDRLLGQYGVSDPDIRLQTLNGESPQIVDSMNCDMAFTNGPTEADQFANYVASLSSNQLGLFEGSDEDQVWSDIPATSQNQPHSSLMAYIDEQPQRAHFLRPSTRNGELGNSISGLLDFQSPATTASDVETTTAQARPTGHCSLIRRPRRQNHSCDQCRSSKRACDLPMSVRIFHKTPSVTCSTCKNRGMTCTVVWLAGRKSKSPAKSRAEMFSCMGPELNGMDAEENRADLVRSPIIGDISGVESDLSRKLDTREISLQYFNLYVDVWDMPISECLLRGSMPPRYVLGIGALAPLSVSENFSIHLKRANGWVSSCWETNANPPSWSCSTTAPHIFRTVTLLDTLFQCRDNNKSSHMHSSLRFASINDTYKWVAIATAAQYTISNENGSNYSREVAIVTWRKARGMLFKNMAATNSFRQSLSMILFGLIIRPNITPEDDDDSETDSVYALCEGIRRLNSLCVNATSHLQARKDDSYCPDGDFVWEMSPDVIENLLELIGAIQCLAKLVRDVVIGTSRGTICPMLDTATDLDAASLQKCVVSLQSFDPANSVSEHNGSDIENSTCPHTMTERQTLMALERSGGSYTDVKQAVRDLVPLLSLLWQALASFLIATQPFQKGKANYEAIASHYKTTMKLIEMWRLAFGIFDDKSIAYLKQSPSEIRRIFAFCVNDGDLAVLLFYEAVQSLEKDFAERPTAIQNKILCDTLHATRSSLQEQRGFSAAQISSLSSICGRTSSPGFEDNGGLKAFVQDIGAHPNPIMVVQAQTLSASTFADEVSRRVCDMDMKGVSEMADRLDTCLGTLQGLQKGLATFPSVSVTA